LLIADLADFVKLQKTRADSPKSWTVDAKTIDPSSFDLSVKNPNGGEAVAHRSKRSSTKLPPSMPRAPKCSEPSVRRSSPAHPKCPLAHIAYAQPRRQDRSQPDSPSAATSIPSARLFSTLCSFNA
jgi:hypothetical protein